VRSRAFVWSDFGDGKVMVVAWGGVGASCWVGFVVVNDWNVGCRWMDALGFGWWCTKGGAGRELGWRWEWLRGGGRCGSPCFECWSGRNASQKEKAIAGVGSGRVALGGTEFVDVLGGGCRRVGRVLEGTRCGRWAVCLLRSPEWGWRPGEWSACGVVGLRRVTCTCSIALGGWMFCHGMGVGAG
jgi:hypothetical protein